MVYFSWQCSTMVDHVYYGRSCLTIGEFLLTMVDYVKLYLIRVDYI